MRAPEFAPSILVVDDDPHVRQFFAYVLTKAGYHVHDVSNGIEAKAAIKNITFNLMILDLSMPEMDGYEVLKFARSQIPDLRIIVASGHIPGTMMKTANLFGAVATLHKPFEVDLLLSTVRSALENRESGADGQTG
jgi:DNA-binding NtrC family response regulator